MALLKIYDGTAWVTTVAKVWNGSAWELTLKFWDGTAWVDLFSNPLTASRSPSVLNTSGPNGPLTSGSCTCTPSGGTPNYTFAWEKVSGTTLVVNSPTSAATTFSHTGTNVFVEGRYRCKVTDANSDIAYTPYVRARFTHGNPQ